MNLLASRIASALAHRSWGIDGQCCHLFLVLCGRAPLTGPGAFDVEATAPAMLWLPHKTPGNLTLAAGSEGFVASVSPDYAQRVAGEPELTVYLRTMLERPVLAGPDMRAPQLATLPVVFAALIDEAQGRRPAATAMAGLHFAALLLLLWRCTGPSESARPGAGTAQRFRQLVELHYREGLRIDAFAARLGVTRSHLHEACLRATGRTPLALLHEPLLAEARTRLEQTDLSVEQVGYGIGFRDPGYFNRFFRRLAGQSPGAYRRSVAGHCKPGRPAAVTSFAAWP